MSAADLLRRAADLVDQRAAAVPCPAWRSGTYEDSAGGTRGFVGGQTDTYGGFVADVPSAVDAHWIAMLGPQIATPLAAWLRAEADGFDEVTAQFGPSATYENEPALALARALLGESEDDAALLAEAQAREARDTGVRHNLHDVARDFGIDLGEAGES